MGLHSKSKRIWLTFEWDRDAVELLKLSVPGIRWDETEKLWHAPLEMDVARDIAAAAKTFGVGVRVEPELVTWVKAEKARYGGLLKPDDTLTDQSKMLPRCRIEQPQIIKAMTSKPWQMPGASFIAGQRNVLLADEPGLGKTLQTLAAIIENNVRGPILVVAPKTAVAVTWPEEIAQWLGDDEWVFVVKIGRAHV